jgi:hypothetical protein
MDMDKVLKKIIKVIEETQNFYPLDLVKGRGNAKTKLKRTLRNLRNSLPEEKWYLIERLCWIWGYMVFENTRKEIIKNIEEIYE